MKIQSNPEVALRAANSLSVINQPIAALTPYEANARTHTKHQIRQIAESIRVFGFLNPVLVDAKNRIIAGHGRVQAAKKIGMEQVPTIRIEGLSEEQIRAYIIADNKLAENAGWDKSILAIELQHLMTLDCADLDVTITGFETPEIDAILEEAQGSSAMEDPVPEPDLDHAAVTEPGDLWQLGKHRVICGNSLHDDTYRTLMGSRRATSTFTDPPFNQKINGHATGNGAIKHREFAMASGEMSEAEFVSFLNNCLRQLNRYSANNSVHYICMDWRHAGDLIAAGKQNYDEFLNMCVWVKDNGGMGSFYRSQHELILVFRKGKTPHRNNIQLGRFGRNRTNVWKYPGIHTLSKQGDEGNLLALHPTVKPVAMVADAILDCSARGEVVLDAFLGSGTTLMATERVGRVCCGIEIDPLYVDVAIRRWQTYTGDAAVHALTGKRFDEVAALREEAYV
jgi:DNA modification methylase